MFQTHCYGFLNGRDHCIVGGVLTGNQWLDEILWSNCPASLQRVMTWISLELLRVSDSCKSSDADLFLMNCAYLPSSGMECLASTANCDGPLPHTRKAGCVIVCVCVCVCVLIYMC